MDEAYRGLTVKIIVADVWRRDENYAEISDNDNAF